MLLEKFRRYGSIDRGKVIYLNLSIKVGPYLSAPDIELPLAVRREVKELFIRNHHAQRS